MPIEIMRLLGFDGPNLYGPQPGVALHARSQRDRGAALRNAIKDAGQQIGLVIGVLDVQVEPVGELYAISARFATPTPQLGVELVRYVLDGLNAHEAGDDDWDAEEPIWELQRRRRSEAVPLPALQLVAEARRRDIPVFQRADGLIQCGYGVRGITFDPTQLPSALPWEELGDIPIIVVSGGVKRQGLSTALARMLEQRGTEVGFAQAADFDAIRALLSQPQVALAVIDLEPESLLRRGLPFEHCRASVLAGLPEQLPGAFDRTEIARAVALPMLVTTPDGRVVIDDAAPELVALASYAPCHVNIVNDLAAALAEVVQLHSED